MKFINSIKNTTLVEKLLISLNVMVFIIMMLIIINNSTQTELHRGIRKIESNCASIVWHIEHDGIPVWEKFR